MVFIGHLKIYNWNQDKIKLILVPIFVFMVKGRLNIMKEKYITIAGMNHYYGLKPFSVGKKVKCMKDKNNPRLCGQLGRECKGERGL